MNINPNMNKAVFENHLSFFQSRLRQLEQAFAAGDVRFVQNA